ncbi:MAG: MaoC/PaaZ C-terminal domain-containing protein [Pseudomonadota bacterium]
MPDMLTREGLSWQVGEVLGVSRWVPLSPARIAAFAEVTEDRQPIHLEAQAGVAAGFDGAVAHGFLTLSMLSTLSYDVLPTIDGSCASVNYGFDRIRFIAPVPAGAQIRARFLLEALEPRGATTEMLTLGASVEIEGQSKPALDALWRVLYIF